VVGVVRHHQLRHGRGRVDSRVHQGIVSTSCKHVREVTELFEHGGASLNILSGLVAGNFSAFWMGLIILGLMFASYLLATLPVRR